MEYKRQFRGIFITNKGNRYVSKSYARIHDAKRWVTQSTWRGGSGWVEYVDTVDWKRWDDSLKNVVVPKGETPHHTAVVSISDSMTADPVMPLGHLIGQEIYNTLCTMYDQAQANDEVPGKLIIESTVNDQYRATDYHISLFTTKVE